MKSLGLGILGFFLALVALTLFTPFGVGAVLFSYGCLLYLLFFAEAALSLSLLAGYTLGLELLSAHHFGTAAATSVILYGLFLLFGLRLRFTSPYARFIVAMLLGLGLASAILYPLAEYTRHLLSVVIVALLVGAGGAILHRASEPSAYELL